MKKFIITLFIMIGIYVFLTIPHILKFTIGFGISYSMNQILLVSFISVLLAIVIYNVFYNKINKI